MIMRANLRDFEGSQLSRQAGAAEVAQGLGLQCDHFGPGGLGFGITEAGAH